MMAETSQLARLTRMHKDAQEVLGMNDRQREYMLSQIRELKRLMEIEEAKVH